MDILGYRLVCRSDPSSNDKRGGVFVCFKFSISMLHECINLEITIDGNLCNLMTFVKNLGLNLEFTFDKNPYLTLVVGDFNAKNHITGTKTIKPQLVGLNLRS